MNRLNIIVIRAVAFALFVIAVSSRLAIAQTTSLVGTWTLVSNEIVAADGSRKPGFGPNPTGLAMFDAGGRYSIQILAPGRPNFASNDRLKGTPEENQAFVTGNNPHFGKYSVNDKDHTITFAIEHAAFPNWDGTNQVRAFTLIGDTLKYTTPASAFSDGHLVEVVWQRAK